MRVGLRKFEKNQLACDKETFAMGMVRLTRCNDTIPLCAVPCNNITECPDGFDEAASPLNCTQVCVLERIQKIK